MLDKTCDYLFICLAYETQIEQKHGNLFILLKIYLKDSNILFNFQNISIIGNICFVIPILGFEKQVIIIDFNIMLSCVATSVLRMRFQRNYLGWLKAR